MILGWGGLIFLLMALTNEGWTWVEWIISPLFMLGISLFIYGSHIFYRDLGRAALTRIRRSKDPAD